ncbi:MAG: TldD/PmbA family protein, partial [Erysipelotrichaceae bacterium]|nr:TldD/PmbA family protein [Erysipelotrichaceae bacterium]
VAENETIYIRAIKDGKMVSASTENISDIKNVFDEMAVHGTLIDEDKAQEIFKGSDNYKRIKTHADTLSKVSNADKIKLCLDIESKAFAYDKRISEVEGVEYKEVFSSTKIHNSKGLKLSRKTNYALVYLSVVAKDENDTKTGGYYQFSQDLNCFDQEVLVKKACDEAILSLNGTPCASKNYKALLSPTVFASLVSFLLRSVSGEEVNKGKSLLKDKLNQQIASNKLTIVENPFNKDYPFFIRCFDDEGVTTSKKNIIEKGVLKTFLYNISAAKEAGVNSTGNGYGGSLIGVDTSFVEVKPSKICKEELCKKIKNGVFIDNVEGLHSGMNAMTGDFSLQASGYRIEDGKITTPLNLITIAGNLFTLFKDVSAVGSDTFVTLSGISSPSVVVSSLAVSGK